MRRRLAAALLALVVLAGCGSTAQQRDEVSATPLDQGLSVPAAGRSAQGGSGGTTGAGGVVAVGAGGSGAAPGGAGSGTPAASSGGTAGGPVTRDGGPETGRGFTKDEVRIGVGTADDAQALADSFGVSGVGYEGDPHAWFDAVIEDVNGRGGLAGRKIVLVKHDYNTAQMLNDPATAHQAACATWVDDNEVYAVLLAGLVVDDNLLDCLSTSDTPLVYVGAGSAYPIHYSATYERNPLYFNLAQMLGERFDRLAIGRLVARGFFEPWDTRTGAPSPVAGAAKVGLLGFDDTDGEIQLASQQRELDGHGLTDRSVIACPRALTSKIQCMQSAVLRFASEGVTHVFGADTVFMNQAQTQAYFPRYFIHAAIRAFAANAPARQLAGAMAEGYIPYSDVENSEYPGDPSPATARCKALMAGVGQESDEPSTLLLQLSVCDAFLTVEAATELVGGLGPDAFRAGMEGLGQRQPSALTFRTVIAPGEHATAAAVRDLEYRSDIQRFAYVSATDHAG